MTRRFLLCLVFTAVLLPACHAPRAHCGLSWSPGGGR